MQIDKIKYANKAQTQIIINGGTTAPFPLQNFYGEYVEQWLAQGNEIEEYQTLEEAKKEKKREITANRNAEISALKVDVDINSNTYQFDADQQSIANLTGIVALFSLDPTQFPSGYQWRTTDNKNVDVTYLDLINIGAAMMQKVTEKYQQSWQIKDQIDDPQQFTTIEEIGSIEWA